jgi:hypothetical protein
LNKKSRILEQLQLLNKIKKSSQYGSKDGFVKVWPNNAYEHEKVKFDIAFKLINEGWHVFSEVRMNGNIRADLVAISKSGVGAIIEIETPKTPKEWEKKLRSKLKYPKEFNLIIVNSNTFDIDKLKI